MRRSDRARRFIQMAAAAATLAACNGSGGNTDAGHTGADTGADAGGPAAPLLPSAVASGTSAMTSCVGTTTHPTPGADISITMTLKSFGENGDTANGAEICFCPNNILSTQALATMTAHDCGTCQDVTSDATGHVTVTAQANGWYAYRVFFHQIAMTQRTTFLDSIQVNEPAPAAAGGMVDGNAVSQLIATTISEAQLITRDPTATTIAGRIFDCAGNDMSNVIVRAFHQDGTEIPEGAEVSAAHFRYFDGTENPDASATWTNSDGLYVALNVPPVGHSELIRVEAWANTAASVSCTMDSQCGTGTCDTTLGQCLQEAHRIGCEAVPAFPNGVSIINIGPLRSDYEATDPCHL